ncbi:AzlC family ABC transporter permease [Nocardioides sp. CER19]|uniref:AzlC family ABC transporter permease n=1 Tax=Nocardioides sp. CER19 TaxID=3038538 RepID=UPI00244AC988|nr:AzlC family ABC transporter permease [Nocardioides sp. CER19]MDH2413889.1 AzlC family ABC transporter permease [Nocardioides sp. CER19]
MWMVLTRDTRRGLAVGAGLAAAAFALAVTFGALAVAGGLPPLAAVIMSAVTFSGSAQFAFVTALTGSGGVAAGLGTATLMNLRFLPMATACAPALRGGRVRRALEAQLVVDGSWAAAQDDQGRVQRSVLIPATVVQWPSWIVGTAIGAYAAPDTALSSSLGLDVVFPAFFAVLVLDIVRRRPELRTVVVASGVLTLLLLWVVPVGAALLAGCLPGIRTYLKSS